METKADFPKHYLANAAKAHFSELMPAMTSLDHEIAAV
jgi:hypothetical protein